MNEKEQGGQAADRSRGQAPPEAAILPPDSRQSRLPERNIGLARSVVNHLTPHRSIRDNGLFNFAVAMKADPSPLMPPKAILLDFDGVIAETENHHVAAWQRTLSTLGWQVSDEVAARSAEIDDREFLAKLFAERGVVSDKIEEWVRRKQASDRAIAQGFAATLPWIGRIDPALHERARLAVVSGTWRENIQTVLEAAGLAECFNFVVGKEDVKAVKPAPEAYELALKKLRITAKSAVAIEDSPSGVAAARAAGLRVIAVGHRRAFGDWVGNSLYVSGFEPVEGMLEHLKL